jgi:hypothetical protein
MCKPAKRSQQRNETEVRAMSEQHVPPEAGPSPRSQREINELRKFIAVSRGLEQLGGGHITPEGFEMLEGIAQYIEKLDKIWAEGGTIIHARGYQIRGMMTAMGDQGRRIKTLERYMMYYRDHVLSEVADMLKAIEQGPPETARERAAHALLVIDRRRKPNAAREAVRKMERNSLSYKRRNPSTDGQ